MKAVLTSLVSVSLLVALAPPVHADDAAAIATGSGWFEGLMNWGDLPASKTAPVTFAVVSKHPRCKKLKVGKTTKQKVADQLGLCFANAHGALIFAESDYAPTSDGWRVTTDVKGSLGTVFNKKQRKAITAAAADTTIVTNTYQGEDDSGYMQAFVAVGADGVVRAVWLYMSPDLDY